MAKKKPSQTVKTKVGGNVGGDLNAAGHDINHIDVLNIYHGLPAERQRYLPPNPPELVLGRGEILERAKATLLDGKSVMLYGLGGMGKTTLALTLAALLLEEKQGKAYTFPDGVLWLTVLGRSMSQLCDEIFRAKNQPDLTTAPEAEKPDHARRLLGTGLLVVLDDVNHDNPAGIDWKRQCQPPGAPLLVTSREVIRGFGGERVEELDRPNAVILLRHHCGKETSARLNETIADQFCAQLGDHPLAVELLGQHLARYYPNDPASAVQELGAAHQQIKAISRGDKKEDDVFTSLRLSWDRLNAKEKRLLTALAAFFAPATGSDLLQHASGLDSNNLRKAEGDLTVLGLIRQQGEKWSVHALVAAFAQAIDADTWILMQRSAVLACVAYAHTHNSEQRLDHDLLEIELKNLLDAADWADRNEILEAAYLLAFDLHAVSQFMDTRGYSAESVGLLNAGIHASQSLGYREDEGTLLGNLGTAYFDLGHLNEAVNCYEQAREIHRETGFRIGEARDLGNLGNAFANLDNLTKSIDYLNQAMTIYQEIGDRPAEGITLANLGNVYFKKEEFGQALDCYLKALNIHRATDDRRGVGKTLGNLGVVYANLLMFDQAIETYMQQLVIAREIGDRPGEATALFNLGLSLEQQNRIPEAIHHIKQAHVLLDQMKLPLLERCNEVLARLRRKD